MKTLQTLHQNHVGEAFSRETLPKPPYPNVIAFTSFPFSHLNHVTIITLAGSAHRALSRLLRVRKLGQGARAASRWAMVSTTPRVGYLMSLALLTCFLTLSFTTTVTVYNHTYCLFIAHPRNIPRYRDIPIFGNLSALRGWEE